MFAKRSQSVRGGPDMPERRTRRKSSRNAELSSLFTFRVTKVSTVTGIGGVVVAKPRTVVTVGLVSSLRVSKVSTVTGIGGGRGREERRERLRDRGEERRERREEIGERREERKKRRGERGGERG